MTPRPDPLPGDYDTSSRAGTPVPDDQDARVGVLAEAVELTTGERNRDYGSPYDNHAHIARIFNAITGYKLSARDIVLVHQATKLSRRMTSPLKRDHYVDGCAYTGIEYECVLEEIKQRPSEEG